MRATPANRFVVKHQRDILVALARSDDERHRSLAAALAPLMGTTVDRAGELAPVAPIVAASFARRR